MVADLRLALRGLAKNRSFTFAAVVTLALGIGASTAIFTIVYGVLLRPLPFAEPDRIVRLVDARSGGAPVFAGQPFTNVTHHAWTPVARTIGPIESYDAATFTVGLGEPARVRGAYVSGGFFQMLGITPQLGRLFQPGDGTPETSPSIVISDALWTEHFGRGEDAVGRTLTVDGRPHMVVGVAPSGFAFPGSQTRMWVVSGPVPPPKGGRIQVTGGALARLAPGATVEAAAIEGTQAARSVEWPMAADFFLGAGANEVRVQTLTAEMTGAIRPVLLLMAAAVGCLLLIGCANVANLVLSRGVARERELAVRVAMGAGRWRLIRQLLSESVLLAVAGGALGLGLATAAIAWLPYVAPAAFPRVDAIQVDWRVYAFALVVSLSAGIIAGLVPALRGATPELVPALREGSGASAGRKMTRVRSMFLASEAALAVMLLIAAMLLGRSLTRLMDTDPGFDRHNVLTTRIHLPRHANSDTFLEELLGRLRAVPGITAAGAANMMPLGESTAAHMFTPQVPGRAPTTVQGRAYWVTPGYAEAVGLRLRGGRLFDAGDLSSPLQSMLVNEEFVRTALGGVEPLGLQVPSMLSANTTAQIVGVVGDVLKEGPAATRQPEVYIPAPAHKYSIRGEINLVVRTSTDAAAHAATIRSLVRELRSDAALDPVVTMTEKMTTSVAQPRFAAIVLGAFAVAALTLAAIGLYGVLAYGVARRQRELGVRASLGATRTALIGMVVREGMTVMLAGAVVGIAGAAAVTRLMSAMLFEVEPLDTWSFAVALIVLAAVALFGCMLPAARAASVDPAIALRAD